MAGATRPICVWCDTESGDGSLLVRPPNYRQDLVLRTVDGKLVWLHLQCLQQYQEAHK